MENKDYQFPEELLSKPLNERLDYFQRLTINHRIMQHTINELLEAIYEPAGSSIIMVFGPSGVGKTTLKRLVEMKVTEKLLPQLKVDRGMIPITGIELVSPDLGNFNWKDYYRRSLEALYEPMINNKINYEKRMDPEQSQKRISPFTIRTAPELRKSLEKAFTHRRPIAFIIDEAQHFAKMSTGKRLQDQLDSIKSLANMTNTTHILIGTYDLLSFANLSGQLSRRTTDLNFPRYTLESKQDIEDFQQIIYSLQNKLPLKEQTDLLEHWEFIYERSVGCVGILKNWLDRCLFGVLKDGKEKIELEDLEKYALSIHKVEKIISEILLGEAMITGDNEKRTRVQWMLGFNNIETDAVKNIKEKTKSVVGKRKPKRDQVGF